MRQVFVASIFAVASTMSIAQEAAPELDDLGLDAPVVESELDILSQQGENTEFPDLARSQARKPISVTLRALNKVTAKYIDLTIDMDQPAAFGSLEITPRFCDKQPPEEFPETSAFVEIRDTRPAPDSDIKTGALAELESIPEVEAPQDALAPLETTIALPEGMIFSGWMFASSPGLNGLEHPVYDVWVIDCKTAALEN